ncbi:MAG TPA: TPM domain-containing protein [Thermoanaerobaculia bacterium]|nr:TPM domain-containing protein [Thermoanaerobaculia bacterium]
MFRQQKLTTLLTTSAVLLIVGWPLWAMLYREGMCRWDVYFASHGERAQLAHATGSWSSPRYVTDTANILDSATARRIHEMLAALERETSNRVIVHVARPGATAHPVASNGVRFVVFPGDRRTRIEAGHGLEGVLTGAQTKRIVDDVVEPLFQRRAYSEGIEAGTRAIADVVRGEGNARGFRLRAVGFVIVMTFIGFAIFVAALVLLAFARTLQVKASRSRTPPPPSRE